MKLYRKLLLPFSPLYGLAICIRNFLYEKGKLKSWAFNVPIIGIGNLTTGGTGKTPHVEYIIRLLQNQYRLVTLSRGYGRKTKGYMLAEPPSNTHLIGDEPMQYLTKFRNIGVCVSENRVLAIENLLRLNNPPEVILMDDAYQHRQVRPGLNILLIEYDSFFKTDFLLPAGNLREPVSGYKRADIIIVTKTPALLVPIERKKVLEKLQAQSHQQVFFSFIRYGEFNRLSGQTASLQIGANYYTEKRFTILLVTGIANPSGLIEYLNRLTDKIEMLIFPDHHEFSSKDIQKIQQTFNIIANPNKIIVTTEKDAMRLKNPDIERSIRDLPVFFVPIEIHFHQDELVFNQLILDYVRKNQSDKEIPT